MEEIVDPTLAIANRKAAATRLVDPFIMLVSSGVSHEPDRGDSGGKLALLNQRYWPISDSIEHRSPKTANTTAETAVCSFP